MSRRIYVAGSSAEMERAHWAMNRVVDAGYTLTMDWVREIREAGSTNPSGWSRKQKRAAALKALGAVEKASVVWLLVPAKPSIGAWVELGYAFPAGKQVVASGKHVSIFDCLADEHFDTDEEALEALVGDL